jgi:hypothetical protein
MQVGTLWRENEQEKRREKEKSTALAGSRKE